MEQTEPQSKSQVVALSAETIAKKLIDKEVMHSYYVPSEHYDTLKLKVKGLEDEIKILRKQ